jgi:prepilin-type N-terminal cleavage/methylation domain-containing protein
MKRFWKKSYRGLTLIEVVVSLFIFSLMMVAVSQIFTKAFSGYRSTRATERDVQNAQYALNLLSKELRTSTVVVPTGSGVPSQNVKFYDHSQGRCFYYQISSNALQVASALSTDPADCRTRNVGTPTTVTTGTVSGSFQVTSSVGGGSKRVGKVTISLRISEDATHYANIQTTSSLRDFGNIDL